MKRILIISLLITLLALGFSILIALAMPLPSARMRGQAPSSPSPSDTASPSPSAAVPTGRFLDDTIAVTVAFPDEVRTLPLGEYLVGVVGGEMPASFEMEALKAQAVAARTYTLTRILASNKPEHPDADVCTDHTHCQAYLTAEELTERWGEDFNAYYQKIIDAVRYTDGVCLLYGGAPIEAVFHSSSAGKTASSAEVWGKPLPYLVSVESFETADDVPNYLSSVTVSHADFKSTILRAYPNAALGDNPEEWIGAKTLSPSGRIDTVIIGGIGIPGTELRTLFGLRSTAIEIELTETDVVFFTTGYGHGVGLSQYGANAMARAGSGYEDILMWYYQGASLGSVKEVFAGQGA